MTYLQAINKVKQKYHGDNDVVIFTILYKVSRKIKNKLDFVNLRNQRIDFKFSRFTNLLIDYFEKQKPLGQIVGSTKFCHLTIDIFKNIFEPRTETEIITDTIIQYLHLHPEFKKGADLCCGTGCMGVSIKKYCPHIHMTCIDINPNAIDNTQHNALLNNVKVKTIVGDFYQELIHKKLKFDFIVCNPPYIDPKKINWVMTKYETKISFTNSNDPLFFYKKLIHNKNKILNKHGKIFFENQNAELLII
ncbi:MAG: methyltransferase [Mycoplasmataceae bacterium]|jgi:release factor glutamine methyltransferase|nr:methyltransferase [Mycoplasmataceae bacterium]